MSIEKLIFTNLINSEEYTRKVIPFLKSEYFQDPIDKKIFELIHNYVENYNVSPSIEALNIDLDSTSGLSDDQYTEAKKVISSFIDKSDKDMPWLVDTTESFCKDKSLYNAVLESIKIIDNKSDNLSKGALPQIMSDALSVSFDTSIGHDFIDNASERYDINHSEVFRIPFDIDILNKITNGGLPRKTLSMLLASTGVGKTAVMCHMASANLMSGYNVLYITLEMSEEKIAERIDANTLNTRIQDFPSMGKDEYLSRIEKVKGSTTGKLIIKEYPTASASAANFRHLINELKIKKNFIPDIIYIDYLNICASSRVKNTQANSYTIVKSIAEEIRGLAIEFDLPIVTATQTNRAGTNNSDIELTEVSESHGVSQTVDLLLALISSEELEELDQIMIKQLKNRYNDLNYYKRFVVGIDRSKMSLYDTEDSAQDNISDSGSSNKEKFSNFK